jgi:hypothetical protein
VRRNNQNSCPEDTHKNIKIRSEIVHHSSSKKDPQCHPNQTRNVFFNIAGLDKAQHPALSLIHLLVRHDLQNEEE